MSGNSSFPGTFKFLQAVSGGSKMLFLSLLRPGCLQPPKIHIPKWPIQGVCAMCPCCLPNAQLKLSVLTQRASVEAVMTTPPECPGHSPHVPCRPPEVALECMNKCGKIPRCPVLGAGTGPSVEQAEHGAAV